MNRPWLLILVSRPWSAVVRAAYALQVRWYAPAAEGSRGIFPSPLFLSITDLPFSLQACSTALFWNHSWRQSIDQLLQPHEKQPFPLFNSFQLKRECFRFFATGSCGDSDDVVVGLIVIDLLSYAFLCPI